MPAALDLWENPYGADGTFYTTITTWSNRGKDVDYEGDTYYWTKDREFKKFLNLPRRRDAGFQLAAGVGEEVQRLLRDHGWSHTNSVPISGTP